MKEQRWDSLQSIAGPVSRETFESLLELESLLLRWNQRINLVSPSTIPDLWERHILDSAQLFPLGAGALRWADLGSGGGFPGLVIAVLLKNVPLAHIELVESNRKKASFLVAAAAQLKLPARISAERIEARTARGDGPEIVTARALAALPQLLELASPWLRAGSTGLFHKGREYQNEITESRQHWEFDLVEHPSRVAASGVILEISELRARRGVER